MNHAQLMQALRTEFQEALQRRTSWGRNDVLSVFDQASTAVLAKALDDKPVIVVKNNNPETMHLEQR